jgi:hypothetical protein
VTKKFHIDRLVELGLWGEEVARVAELLGKEQLELMLRGRYAIQRFENMPSSPLKMREAAPLLRKALNRAQASRREAKKVNEDQRKKTIRQKQNAQVIMEDLIRKNPHLRLRGKQTKLAAAIRERWPKHDKAPAISTLRHWLADMRPKK